MTNEELDRWLAENVMGLKICDDPDCEGCDNPTVDEDGSIWLDREDYYRPEEWHPTTNIAQAIEAAEKALENRQIARWFIGRGVDGIPNRGVELVYGPVIKVSYFKMDDAEFLCRAIYRAMMDDS